MRVDLTQPQTHPVPRAVTAAAVIVLLGSIAAHVVTGSYLWLGVPFAGLVLAMMALNWKSAWWFLLFSIPASVQLFFLDGSLSTSVPDEPLMAGFLLLLVVLLCARPGIIPGWFWRHPLTLVVALQLAWTIVAVVFSKETVFSIKFLAAKSWFLASFFFFPVLVFRTKADFRRGFALLLIPLLVTMLIIFYRHYTTGFAFRKIEKSIMNIYYNHVDYSTVMSMVFPVVCAAWPLMRGKPVWMRAIHAGVILFFLPAIYLTYARAAMLAVVFAGGMALAIRWKIVNWVMPVFYGVVALAVVAVAHNKKYLDYYPNYRETYMHATWTDHMAATFRGQDMSSMERVYRWIAATRMSTDRPLVGYGPNSFYEYYKPYAVTSFRTYVSRNLERSTTHNYFLLMLVEQGWPAMLLYAVLVMVFFAQAQKVYHRFKGDRFYRAATQAVAMMFAAGFINNFFSELIETHKVGALFYLSLSLLVVLDWKSRTRITRIEKDW